jgi:hypothetical protein
MRTTLTLDEDLGQQLHDLARRTGSSFKEVVNATLRKGLSRGEKPAKKLPRFVVKAKDCGFQEGIDVLHLNRLVDELEIEDFQRKAGGGI